MEDIFEQMLSNPSWGDSVMMSNNNIAMDSSTIRAPSWREESFIDSIPTMPHPSSSSSSSSSSHAGFINANMPAFVSSISSPSVATETILDNLHLGRRTQRDDEDGDPSQIYGAQLQQAQNDRTLFSQNAIGATANGGINRTRVRARRGQATDPHSIAERKRRERIAERMKALQELVPDSNKTDKASMLDEIISYVKFLQMQVKCLSMCRLGGSGAAAPLLADLPVEGAANFIAANLAQANVGGAGAGPSRDSLAFAERQVAQLMDEDMSAAMQYLQSKGLCLMPISLATAISSTGTARQHLAPLSTERHIDIINGNASGNEQVAMIGMQAIGVMAGNAATVVSTSATTTPSRPKLDQKTVNEEHGSGSGEA